MREFVVGFGPVIFKVQKGETLYSIRIIPLGGFNRIAGMTPDEPFNERSFYNKPAWKKFIVIRPHERELHRRVAVRYVPF